MIKIRSQQLLKNINFKNLATVANSQANNSSYKVVIVGGGSGGIAVSSKLSQVIDPKHIAIVEPADNHYYQPLFTFVGAGIKTLNDAKRSTASVIPKGVQWVKNSVAELNPDQSKVVLADGSSISYDFLVVATGLENKWDKIKGLQESIGKNGVVSNYSKDTVESTWKYLSELKEGNALFTMPSTPIKCAGAPQKIAYLADDYLREKNLRDRVTVDYFTGIGKIFAIEKYGNQLTKICESRNIGVHPNSELIEIDNVNRVAKFKNLTNGDTFDKKYNFLHVTPPMSTSEFVKKSPLANEGGFVDVDKLTLKHVKFDNVYSLGDVSSLPTSKTAAAITEQSGVLAANLTNALQNKDAKPLEYSGYTSCPLITGKGKLILAEFSGYTGQPLETFPVDQSLERKSMYILTKDIIPEVYWNGLLKGRWSGPGPIRNLWKN